MLIPLLKQKTDNLGAPDLSSLNEFRVHMMRIEKHLSCRPARLPCKLRIPLGDEAEVGGQTLGFPATTS